jgi:protoporphyrinogen oxidase
MLGMAVALRLSQRGHDVTILEGAHQVGGLASAWRLGDIIWDRFYHVILYTDEHTRSLLDELGLASEICWKTTRTGFFIDGKWYSLSNVWEFLAFPPLGLTEKLRLGYTIWKTSRITDAQGLDEVPIAEWLTQQCGKRTFETLWLPLLKAKLGQQYQEVSASFIWATIQRMYAARRTRTKQELFGVVPGGYARICHALMEYLANWNVPVLCGSQVEAISKSEDGFVVECADGSQLCCDRVVVTAPCPIAASICKDLSSSEVHRLRSVRYLGVICASLLTVTDIPTYYISNIADDRVFFTAAINMSALLGPLTKQRASLLYLPKYVAAEDPLHTLPDRDLQGLFYDGLRILYRGFQPADIQAFRIARARYVLPLPVLGHRHTVPPMTTSVPGLYLVNSAQIHDGTLNVNETLKLAETAVRRLCPETSHRPMLNLRQPC